MLRDGAIRAMTTAESSASQLNYEDINVPPISAWMQQAPPTSRPCRVMLD